jgi:hypothetical protein
MRSFSTRMRGLNEYYTIVYLFQLTSPKNMHLNKSLIISHEGVVYNLAVTVPTKGFDCFEVSHLNGSFTVQNLRPVAEQFGHLNITLCTDDFTLSISTGNRSRDKLSL